MNITVEQLMVEGVIVVDETRTVGEARERMLDQGIHALPVVDGKGRPRGIVTSSDLVEETAATVPVSEVMTPNVYTVSPESGAHVAARIMRNRRVHHLLVVRQERLIGMLSSFDLLRLVEEHRFVRKE